MDSLQVLGRYIRVQRVEHGLSQEQLALRAGLNTSYVGEIERAAKNPTIVTLEKVAQALDLSLLDLFERAFQSQRHTQSIGNFTPDELRTFIQEAVEKKLHDFYNNNKEVSTCHSNRNEKGETT